MASKCAHHCCQVAAQEYAVRTTAVTNLASKQTTRDAEPVRQSAHRRAQLLHRQSRTCRNTEPGRALNRNKNCVIMAAHDASQVVRVSVTTVPSFLN